MLCEILGCENQGALRRCGHVACDEHTDDLTELCIPCAPVEEEVSEGEREWWEQEERRVDL